VADDCFPSRRPIAGLFRKTANAAVRVAVRLDIHPNTISTFSLVVSAGAAVCFWRSGTHPALLIAAPALCHLRLWFNMLDGMVAIASGKTSRTGEIFNEFPDRVSDVLILAGVAHSGLCSPVAGYWAALLAFFTAYTGTLGQAVGARREYGGIMSKPWRMVALHVGAWTALALGSGRRFAGLTVLDGTCLAIVAGCVETVVVRLVRIFRTLREREATGHERADTDRAHVPDLGRRNSVLPGMAARPSRD